MNFKNSVNSPNFLLVLTTTSTVKEAEDLARRIVEEKLAACVQVLPKIKSFYFWDNEVRNDGEFLLLIKTLPAKFDDLEKFIQAHHSYDVPEIVALEASKVAENYFNWMKDYLD